MSSLNDDLTAEEIAALDTPKFNVNERVTLGVNRLTVTKKASKNGSMFKILKLETKVLEGTNINKPYNLVITSFSKDQFMQLLASIYGVEKVKNRQMQEAEAVGKKIVGYYGGTTTNEKGQNFDQWSRFSQANENTTSPNAF